MPKERKSYTAQKKLEIVDYAELYGNRVAARFFDVGESSIREWRTKKDCLGAAPTAKLVVHKKLKKLWPDLEGDLMDWLVAERSGGRSVSTASLKRKALQMADDKKIANFKGSNCWLCRFMRRYKFTLPAPVAQLERNPSSADDCPASSVTNFSLLFDTNESGAHLRQSIRTMENSLSRVQKVIERSSLLSKRITEFEKRTQKELNEINSSVEQLLEMYPSEAYKQSCAQIEWQEGQLSAASLVGLSVKQESLDDRQTEEDQ